MIKVSRAEWGARRPKTSPLGINTRSATGHWEGTSMGSFPHTSCATKMRVIQNYHMDTQGWNDIAYNFAVCPHGYVFVGRDHGIRSSANGTNSGNSESEAVCFLGGVGDPFPVEAELAYREIMNEISPNVQYCHNHWFNTMCPGPTICNEIKNHYPNLPQGPITPPSYVTEDDLPLHLIIGKNAPEWWITDWNTKRWVQSAPEAAQIIFSTVKTGGKIEHDGNNGPVIYDQATVDAIPTLKA
jgi:hypothetical protein